MGGGLVSEFIWGIVDLKVLKISGQVPIKSLFLDHLATKKQDNSKFTMVNLTKIGQYIAFPELLSWDEFANDDIIIRRQCSF